MKILLIQPPIRDFYRTRFREYPLGLMYLASAFEKAGHHPEILDARRCSKPRATPLPRQLEHLDRFYTRENDLFATYRHFGIGYEEITAAAVRAKPNIVCISAMFTPYAGEAINTALAIKAVLSKVPIIAGGHHATADPDSLMASGAFDAVIRGEGEEAVVNVLNSPFSVIARDGGSLAVLGTSAVISCHPISNLDSLPFPARHLVDPCTYMLGKKRYTMLLTSRGCPHSCSFCSVHTVCGTRHRTRSIDRVIDEIDECFERHGIEAYDLQDDNLLFDVDRIKSLLERAISRYNGKIEFLASNGLNVSSIDEELLVLMKRAGFRKLDIALGTGDVPSRTGLKRPESVEHYEHVLAIANRLEIPVTTYIILGIPTQPLAEMRKTVEYLKTKNTLIAPSIFYNIPGMPVFEEFRKFEYCGEHIARRGSAFNNFGIDFTRDEIFALFREIRLYNLRLL